VIVLALATPAVTLALTATRFAGRGIRRSKTVLAPATWRLSASAPGKLLHDAVPSNIRAGVSSGVGTLSWILF
jgi:hypothetical protein